MSTFKNVSGTDLEVRVDGQRVFVAADATFKVADEFDVRLVDQPNFELVKSPKSASAEITPELSSTKEQN